MDCGQIGIVVSFDRSRPARLGFGVRGALLAISLILAIEYAEAYPCDHASDNQRKLCSWWYPEAPIGAGAGQREQHHRYDEQGVAATQWPRVVLHALIIGSTRLNAAYPSRLFRRLSNQEETGLAEAGSHRRNV